jgi:hypothetical protein
MHAISKIIARHADRNSVEVGEIVNVVPDYVMLNDRGAARAADLFFKIRGGLRSSLSPDPAAGLGIAKTNP